MYVLATEKERGIATVTISFAEDDYKFDVWAEDNTAFVEYQETLSYRGQIRVSEPDEEVFKELMISEEVTELLNEWGVDSIKRAEPTP